MNWRVIIRPNAEADVREAWSWYESQRAGLGDELLIEVGARRFAGWKPILNAVHFITAIFAGCSRAVFLTSFFIVWKASGSLSFASCTRSGNIGGNCEVSLFTSAEHLERKILPAVLVSIVTVRRASGSD